MVTVDRLLLAAHETVVMVEIDRVMISSFLEIASIYIYIYMDYFRYFIFLHPSFIRK